MKKIIFSIILAFGIFSSSIIYASSYHMYTINEGDTYYKVANTFGVDTNSVISINNQSSTNLKPGELIKIKQIKDINVKVNGQSIQFDQYPYIENESVFVPIRFVSQALNADSINWNPETKSAEVIFENKKISIKVGSNIVDVNGQQVKIDAPVQLYVERLYVPVRFFAEVVGVDSIEWDNETYTVLIEKTANSSITSVTETPNNVEYSEEDLYWLSRIVNSEAGSESYEGKLAVANTIINRKNSPSFPNTIKEVIFDTNYAVQYTPTVNGKINETPNQESIDAAREALEGKNNVGTSMYFINPVKSPNSWVQNNRTYYSTVGHHDFYL